MSQISFSAVGSLFSDSHLGILAYLLVIAPVSSCCKSRSVPRADLLFLPGKFYCNRSKGT